MKSEDDYQLAAREFVGQLTQLSNGELAALRRNVGETFDTSRGCSWFLAVDRYGISLPVGFLLATLFAEQSTTGIRELPKAPSVGLGDFGGAFAKVIQARDSSGRRPKSIVEDSRRQNAPPPAIIRRFYRLLDCDLRGDGSGDMPFRLRQLLKIAHSEGVHVDWGQLTVDLSRWGLQGKFVQKGWMKSFFGAEKVEDQEPIIGDDHVN